MLAMVRKVLQKAPDLKDLHVWKALVYKGTSVSIFMSCSNGSARAAVMQLQKHGAASLWDKERVAKQREKDASVRMKAISREEVIGDVEASQRLVDRLERMISAGTSRKSKKRSAKFAQAAICYVQKSQEVSLKRVRGVSANENDSDSE